MEMNKYIREGACSFTPEDESAAVGSAFQNSSTSGRLRRLRKFYIEITAKNPERSSDDGIEGISFRYMPEDKVITSLYTKGKSSSTGTTTTCVTIAYEEQQSDGKHAGFSAQFSERTFDDGIEEVSFKHVAEDKAITSGYTKGKSSSTESVTSVAYEEQHSEGKDGDFSAQFPERTFDDGIEEVYFKHVPEDKAITSGYTKGKSSSTESIISVTYEEQHSEGKDADFSAQFPERTFDDGIQGVSFKHVAEDKAIASGYTKGKSSSTESVTSVAYEEQHPEGKDGDFSAQFPERSFDDGIVGVSFKRVPGDKANPSGYTKGKSSSTGTITTSVTVAYEEQPSDGKHADFSAQYPERSALRAFWDRYFGSPADDEDNIPWKMVYYFFLICPGCI